MTESIIFLIEEALKIKNEETIEKLSSKISIDINQTKLFLKYFNKFNILASLLDSKYTNYFNKISLTDLREKDELTDENFVKAILIFIKEKRKNKKFYHVNLQTETDINLQILILSQLDYKSYKYTISYDAKLDLKKNLNIFNYIPYVGDYYTFESLTKELIDKQIDSPVIYSVHLNYMSFEKILQYSRKYPNRIKYIDFYDFQRYEELKELIELNKESLINYPHSNMKYLIPLKNAYIFNLTDLGDDIKDDYDLTKITRVESIWTEYEGNGYDYIKELLNKCPNVEELQFSDVSSQEFFDTLENIKCPKVKKIWAICEDIDRDYDWTDVFANLPLLERLFVEEHQTMCWTYDISPVFTAENKRLAYPLLEQLIRNYLNGSPERDITLQFDDEFEGFWDYFKDKKDIISRVSKLFGENVNISLDSYFKVTIQQYQTPKDIKDAKYYYCFVELPFDNNIFEFIKRNKVEYLFILGGGNVNFDDLKKCEELKFVFDKTTKSFLYRNKENNILEKL